MCNKQEKINKMNTIQNYGTFNHQPAFTSRKEAKTLADKIRHNNKISNVIADFAKEYDCSVPVAKKALGINSKTTLNQIKNKISDCRKNFENLRQTIKQDLEMRNIFAKNINFSIKK